MTAIFRAPLLYCLASLCTLGSLGAAPALAAGDPLLPGGNGKEPVTITAARLEYLSREKRATYSGNVRAVQGEAHLQCAKLEIFLADKSSGASGGVRRMECFGPVTVSQKDQVGTGDHGTYEKAVNRITLTGHVTLSQGPNVSAGDRLVYDLTRGTAQLFGGATQARVQGIFEPGSTEGATGGAPKRKK